MNPPSAKAKFHTPEERDAAFKAYDAKLDATLPIAASAISAAFVRMTHNHPLLMPSALALDWELWDPRQEMEKTGRYLPCPTAYTNGRKVVINPVFFTELPNDLQRMYLILHEIFHPLMEHLSRMREYDPRTANIATDFEINNMFDEYSRTVAGAGALEAITGTISDTIQGTNYKALAAERIADDLIQKAEEEREKQKGKKGEKGEEGEGEGGEGEGGGEGQGDGFNPADPYNSGHQASSCGEFVPAANPEDAEDLRRKWNEVRANTVNAARMQGMGSGGFVEKLESFMRPPITLDDIFERVLTEIVQTDWGQRTDRRYLASHDLVIPDDTELAAGTIVFIKDTSGSVSTKEAEAVISVVEDSVARLNARRFVVLDVDTEVVAAEELLPGDRCSREFKGRGGTDLTSGFTWVAKHADDAKLLVCFTDGCTPFPATAPEYPVVWIHFGPEVKYPFGDVIDVTKLIAAASR